MVKKKKVTKSRVEKPSNLWNIISIILGSVSIILSFLFPFVVPVTGILGITIAYIKKGKGFNKSNIWAFVLNIIGLFFALVIMSLAFIALFSIVNNSGILNTLGNF